MKKYYLFYIKKDIYETYKNNGYLLYKVLENIYNLKKSHIKYGKNLYEQLCIPFNINIIHNYLKKKYSFLINKNKKYWFINSYTNEITMIKLGYSLIIIKTNVNFPKILKTLEFYSSSLFICDFKNRNFFWLFH